MSAVCRRCGERVRATFEGYCDRCLIDLERIVVAEAEEVLDRG